MFFNKQLTAAALAAAALMTGCGGEKASHGAKTETLPPVKVSVIRATEESVPDTYTATGTVRARVTTVLSARVMGYVRELKVQAGDRVNAGQVIAVLDAKDIDASVRQAAAAQAEARSAMPEVDNAIAAANAQLELANSTLQRMKSLFDQRSITNQEFDEASARQKLAKANWEMAKARKEQLHQKIKQAEEAVAQATVMQDFRTVTAPFAGVVTERKAEPGMLAAPGMPLVTLEQLGNYRLEASVEESRLGSVKPGMAVQVELDTAAAPVAGRVEEIVPAMDPGSRTFTVKVALGGGQTLRSGMFGRARFPMGEKKALLAPWSAIQEQGQVQKVYVTENGVARGRLVTTGARIDGKVEILSGLKSGESLVAPVPAGLVDGGKVEVR